MPRHPLGCGAGFQRGAGQVMFCMFAEAIDLLSNRPFTRAVSNSSNDPVKLSKRLRDLFETMAEGGSFGAEEIHWFNGGLFADAVWPTIRLRRSRAERSLDVSRRP